MEKALLMKLDPNAVIRADATITIEGIDYQHSCNIKKVYEDIVQSGELVTRIANDTGMEITGIDEMVFIDKDLISSIRLLVIPPKACYTLARIGSRSFRTSKVHSA